MATPNFKYLFILPLFLGMKLAAQKKSYDGQGAVSEIIMASPAEIVGHFDLFFKSTVPADEADKHIYWYKIVFNKACTFDFTLFPLIESDRYGFGVFKVENSMNFCEAKANQAITTVKNMQITRTFTDNEQSAAFRSNLVTTRKVPVKAGETVFIVVKNLWGQDQGHIISLNTCDYSYVLEVDKFLSKTDTTKKQETVKAELQEEEALAAIGRKLCPPDGSPVKLGTLSFNKKIEVSNPQYEKGETKNGPQKKIVPSDLTPRSDWETKPASEVLKPKLDSAGKKKEIQAAEKSTVPKPEVWLKERKVQVSTPEIKKKEPSTKNPVSVKSLVPVKCLVSDAVKATPIDNLPTITDELTGKPLPVKKLSNGEYEFSVEKGKTYKVECNVLGYKNFDHSINIYKALNGEENQLELKLQPLVAGENFILKNIYFHPNTPVIKNESGKELEKLYTFMKNNADAVISIEGHTNSNRHISRDSRRQQMGGKWAFHGTAQKLSKYRADEVSSYLIKKGVEASRIKTKGWGGDHELYPNARTIEESSKNMRVEVVILKI